jgi:hypothetical protein
MNPARHEPQQLRDDQWHELLRWYQRSAFRLEQQPIYLSDVEAGSLNAWLAGETTPPAPDYKADPSTYGADTWAARVKALIDAGRTMERVRIEHDPPTPYQQWRRWIGQRHMAAGETHRYLSRSTAIDIGLLPAAGKDDWWLIDEERLIRFPFVNHRRAGAILVTDPSEVAQAVQWRDLATAHAEVEQPIHT